MVRGDAVPRAGDHPIHRDEDTLDLAVLEAEPPERIQREFALTHAAHCKLHAGNALVRGGGRMMRVMRSGVRAEPYSQTRYRCAS
jgi:hypothetical protein